MVIIEAGNNLELAVFEGTVAQGSTGGSALVVAGGGSLAVSNQSAQNLAVNAVENGWDANYT